MTSIAMTKYDNLLNARNIQTYLTGYIDRVIERQNMYTTRIDRKLSALELQEALFYANGAFREYLGLLYALISSNCEDGKDRAHDLSEDPPVIYMAKHAKARKISLMASIEYLIKLDNLKIEPDIYFQAKGDYLLKPTTGIKIPPLRLIDMNFLGATAKARFFAVSISEPKKSSRPLKSLNQSKAVKATHKCSDNALIWSKELFQNSFSIY